VEKNRILVGYKALGVKTAQFEVSCMDLPESENPVTHAGAPSHGRKRWTATGKPEQVSVTGASGNRHRFNSGSGKDVVVKEVSIFQRGTRVFFFTTLYSADDGKTRDQARRSVSSLVWSK
jgi:hypothetical protein